jgi:hypothetical protein
MSIKEARMHTIYPFKESTLLDEIYLKKKEIFIRLATFSDTDPLVTVTCVVNGYYTKKPIPYVTTENYVRCLSQASYLLAEHIVAEHLTNIDVLIDEFRQAAADYQLYYRNLAMTFHERVARGEEFVLKLSVKNAREFRRLGTDFILFTFTNERTVISGEMSFVYLK